MHDVLRLVDVHLNLGNVLDTVVIATKSKSISPRLHMFETCRRQAYHVLLSRTRLVGHSLMSVFFVSSS
jgi:hypothetical protein